MNPLSTSSKRSTRMPLRFPRFASKTSVSLASTFLLATFALEAPARAQSAAIPKGTAPAAAPVTKGTTEIAGTGSFAAQVQEEERKTAKDATEAALNAGGLFMSGNSRTVALTAGGKLRLRRSAHQFGASFFGNYARAGKKDTPVVDTAANLQGLLRYDYFFADNLAVFLQATGRHDKFQGLDFRLTVDPGVAAYLIETKKQRAWVEAGLQLQHDARNADTIAAGSAGAPFGSGSIDSSITFANARFYVGYENQLYETVSFTSGVEYIQNLHESVSRYRLNLDAGIKAKVSDKLAIATTYTMRYENQPLPTIEKTDSIASVNLVYTLF
jgi:putative salt-induced outer membrane protein YdiY